MIARANDKDVVMAYLFIIQIVLTKSHARAQIMESLEYRCIVFLIAGLAIESVILVLQYWLLLSFFTFWFYPSITVLKPI